MPLPRPMATRARPDAEASFAASRRAPDFRFRLPLGRAHARTHTSRGPPSSDEEAVLPPAADSVRRLDRAFQ